MQMFDLSGHTAVVTGGNGGIGLALARGLAKANADVAVWARNETKNAAAVEELDDYGTGRVASFVCDLADETQIEAAMAGTLEEFSKVDSCFANAGMGGGGVPLSEMTADKWDPVQQVNTRGVALVYSHVSRHMIDRGEGGKLVVSGSGQSIMGVNRNTNYAASKAAVNGLTHGAAFELARYGITANALLFGYYETEMTGASNSRSGNKFHDWMMQRIPQRRSGSLEELEGVAVFWASPASNYITGQCLPIDGGLCIS